MSESERDFTIKSYIDYLAEKKLMGSKCKECGAVYVPVRKLCTSCNNGLGRFKDSPQFLKRAIKYLEETNE